MEKKDKIMGLFIFAFFLMVICIVLYIYPYGSMGECKMFMENNASICHSLGRTIFSK